MQHFRRVRIFQDVSQHTFAYHADKQVLVDGHSNQDDLDAWLGALNITQKFKLTHYRPVHDQHIGIRLGNLRDEGGRKSKRTNQRYVIRFAKNSSERVAHKSILREQRHVYTFPFSPFAHPNLQVASERKKAPATPLLSPLRLQRLA
jgi:hypothetical protein